MAGGKTRLPRNPPLLTAKMSRPKRVWILYVPGVGFEPTRPFRDQRF